MPKVGDKLRIQGEDGSWYEGHVKELEAGGKKLKVSYDDYDSSWDLWLPSDSERLRSPSEHAFADLDTETALDAQRRLAAEGRKQSIFTHGISMANGRLREMTEAHKATHTNDALRLMTQRNKGEKLTWREATYLLVNEPSSSISAYLFARFSACCVVLCCCGSMMESVEYITTRTGSAMWLYLRLGFNIWFTVEAALRIFGTIPVRRALLDYQVWLDLWSMAPFWMRAIAYPSSITLERYLLRHSRSLTLRSLEASSMTRLLKLSSHYYGAELLFTAVSRAARELLVPAFFLAILGASAGVEAAPTRL